MHKKYRVIFLIFFTFSFLFFGFTATNQNIEARSGCCSHHDGVCGCGCCDGTSLSAKCAPYYPQCSQPKPVTPTYTPPQPKIETPIPTEPEPAQEEVQPEPETNSQEAKNNETNNSPEFYSVTKVVDGDTIKVEIDGNEETIRLIGIDTPETVQPEKPVECFGKEASNKMKDLVEGKKVRLENDEQNSDQDKYDRLLRYVYLEDDTLVNAIMIQEGYAHAYTEYPFRLEKDFKSYQEEAGKNRKGLWADGVCEKDSSEEESSQDNYDFLYKPLKYGLIALIAFLIGYWKKK